MTSDKLRRYTDLASVLRMLRERAMTLLPPSNWDDRNDRNLMAAYQRGANRKTVLALCFAQAEETYHHWKVFSSGKDGICVVFDKRMLEAEIKQEGVRYAPVKYFTLKELRASEPPLNELPFSKRSAYKDEQEYRILFESDQEDLLSKDVLFPVAAIDRILVNPWLPLSLVEAVKNTIHEIPGLAKLKVTQSTVIDAPAWRQLANRHT